MQAVTRTGIGRVMAVAAALALVLFMQPVQPARAGVVALDEKVQQHWDELLAGLDALKTAPSVSAASAASGSKRLALVVGNDAYVDLSKLDKATGDATAIASALGDLGFTVTALRNVGRDDFDDALERFYEAIAPGDVAFFFFAGHGVQAGEINYLLPIDMPSLDSTENPRLERNAVDAGQIVSEITSRGAQLAFVVLDACRDDPFAGDTRGATRIGGLARMEPQQGAFILYSAGAGQTALDRLSPQDDNPNSVFTRKFRQILETPGMPIVEIAKRTQVEVKALADKVHHPQAPAYYDQVIGQFYFRKPEPKLYGLVIGIDEYDREVRLRGAANDARLVADALRHAGAAEVVEAVDRDARLAFIDYAWRNLVDKARAGDTIVFSYAGASFRAPAPADTTEADGKDEYLALADADWNMFDNGNEAPDDGTNLSDDVVTEWMELAAAKNLNVVFLVDGCHGGGLLDREFANISFIGASAEDEFVQEYEIDGQYHGAMSVAFADAIRGAADYNGDGFVSQRELFAITEADLFSKVRFRQTPQYVPAVAEAGGSLALFRTGTARSVPGAPDR
jgi:uncharacterized caspase-like protein